MTGPGGPRHAPTAIVRKSEAAPNRGGLHPNFKDDAADAVPKAIAAGLALRATVVDQVADTHLGLRAAEAPARIPSIALGPQLPKQVVSTRAALAYANDSMCLITSRASAREASLAAKLEQGVLLLQQSDSRWPPWIRRPLDLESDAYWQLAMPAKGAGRLVYRPRGEFCLGVLFDSAWIAPSTPLACPERAASLAPR